MRSYSDLTTPKTQDELLAVRVQDLQGIGFVHQAGGESDLGAGTGTLVLSGVGHVDASVVVEIVTGGEPGDAASEYRLSTDGGVTFGADILIPTTSVDLGATGARAVFTAGTDGSASFVAGDTYSFDTSNPVFDATAWQAESVPRRLLDLETGAATDHSEAISAVATGAYLRDAEAGWVDLHAADVFDELRSEAVFAEGVCVLTDAAGIGPVVVTPGQLWAGNAAGTLRYSNVGGGTLAVSGTLALTFRAESPGASWNAGNGAITQLLTPIPGVTVTNPSRISVITKSRSGSPDVTAALTGTMGGDCDVVVEITSAGALGAAGFRYSLDGGTTWDVSTITVPGSGTYVLGTTGMTLTFAAGAYSVADTFSFDASVSWLSQSGVNRETDAAVKVRCSKKWSTLAVGEPNAAFEVWAQDASVEVVKVLSRASPTVAGQIEVWLAGAAGGVTAGAVTAVGAYLAPLVGLTCTLLVQSATALAVALTGTVYVKAGQLGRAQATAYAAIAAYQAATPIGGNVVGGSGILSREALIGCITGGSNGLIVDDLTLSGPAADVALAATETPVITVSGLTWVEN